jgi:acrylyl-CoA reductase (NADPH)
MTTFQALRITKNDEGSFGSAIETRSIEDLPAGEVLIRVQFSSLNFKDALSASGNPGVTREYPHTPGIDAAGVVESSESASFKAGDEVIVTGYDLGMNTAGGLAQYIRVPADWVIPLPTGLSCRESMIIGTAGLTAALCVAKLQQMGIPEGARTVVSGASGGVGSFAVALLAQLGYLPVASTGSAEAAEYLQGLGADQIQDRAILSESNSRPMLRGEWDAGIDTVGGDTLANIIKGLNYGGSVAAVGLVGGTDIPVGVFPFILRDVNLLGVDSVEINHQRRLDVWGRLASDWKLSDLEGLATDATLADVPDLLSRMLQGGVRGRVVVTL